MKKVLLFACVEKNIGDDLFIYILCNRYKRNRFIITNIAKYGDLQTIPNLSFSYLLKLITFFSGSSTTYLKHIVKKYIYYTLRLWFGSNNTVVFIVGNILKNYNYCGKHQILWLKDYVRLSSNFYFLSTNYGPCSSKRWINDCADAFANMTDICFRDKNSFEIFSNLKNVRYAPDAVLTLKTNINKYKYANKVVISIINCRDWYSNNVAAKTDDYENKISEISDKFAEMGFDVVILCAMTTQDYPAAKRIKEKCENVDKISIFKYFGNIEDVFELYRKSKYVISTRLHSMILAWVFKTPVFPISYDIKVSNIINSYKFNNPYCQLSDIDKLSYSEIMHAFKNYDYSFFDNLPKEAEKQFAKLDNLLNNKCSCG